MARPTPSLRRERVAELGDLARDLAKLTEHPSWSVLRSEFDKRKTAYLAKLVRKLAAGGVEAPPVNQREIDYQRGFLRGAQAVLDSPDNALKMLEKALREEDNG